MTNKKVIKNIFRSQSKRGFTLIPRSSGVSWQGQRGFTLGELLISIFILSILTITVTSFQRDIFILNRTIDNNLSAQLELRRITKIMVSELRKSSVSSVGGYPISIASTSELVFFSDISGDGLKERVRYFVNNNRLLKGVVVPSGNPLTYNLVNEAVTTLMSDVRASSTQPIFQYFSEDYSGSSLPLSFPVNIPDIRLIKITVIIDKDPNLPPAEIVGSSQVNLRNLKDNL